MTVTKLGDKIMQIYKNIMAINNVYKILVIGVIISLSLILYAYIYNEKVDAIDVQTAITDNSLEQFTPNYLTNTMMTNSATMSNSAASMGNLPGGSNMALQPSNYSILDYIDSTLAIDNIANISSDLTDDIATAHQIKQCKQISDNTAELRQSSIANLAQSITDTANTATCQLAYSDFMLNNSNIDAKVIQICNSPLVNNQCTGQMLPGNVSLSNICPVTCSTPEYTNCLNLIKTKYAATAEIAQDIGDKIDGIIADNINNKIKKVNNMQSDLSQDFADPKISNYLKYETAINQSTDVSILPRVNNYYTGKMLEGFIDNSTTITLDQQILTPEQQQFCVGSYAISPSYTILDNILIEITPNEIDFIDGNTTSNTTSIKSIPIIIYKFDRANNVDITGASTLTLSTPTQSNLTNSTNSTNLTNSTNIFTALSVNPTNKFIFTIPGIALHLSSARQVIKTDETTQILTLLNQIGFTPGSYIYISQLQNPQNSQNNSQYYTVMNSNHATLFQIVKL